MESLKQIGIDLEVSRVIENERRSFDESENDILRRLVLPLAACDPVSNRRLNPVASETGAETFPPPPPGTRNTGRWSVHLLGERHAEPNLKSAYRKALLLLAGRYPSFLADFAAEGGRGRKFIARTPSELYLSSPKLARKHAAPLVDGWFFDTNLSTDQVSRRVKAAARLCGLRYGSDLRLTNNLEQI